MKVLHFAFLLVLATAYASPLPTHRSPSGPVSIRDGRNHQAYFKGSGRDSEFDESGNIYNFHHSLFLKAAYPPWYQEQADEPKQKYPKKWAKEENDFELSQSNWSHMFGKKINAIVASKSEKSVEKSQPESPDKSTNHIAMPEASPEVDHKREEPGKEAKTKDSAHEPQRNKEDQSIDLGKIFTADLPQSTQNINVPNQSTLGEVNNQRPSSHFGYESTFTQSHNGHYPAFVINAGSPIETNPASFQNNFNGHQGGHQVNGNRQPIREGDGEYQVFLTKENLVESFPNYQGAVSYSYNSIADGQLEYAGHGGGDRFYSIPYSSQGQSSENQLYQHGNEKIPHFNDYTYQFGVLALPVSGGTQGFVNNNNKGQNHYLPPTKQITETSTGIKVEGSNNENDSMVNPEKSREEIAYQVQVSHNVPVHVDPTAPEDQVAMANIVKNEEQVTEVVILESENDANAEAKETGHTNAQVMENVLIIEESEMTDAGKDVECAEPTEGSLIANEEETTPVAVEAEKHKDEDMLEVTVAGVAEEITSAAPSDVIPTEGSVKELHSSVLYETSLGGGLAANSNPKPEKEFDSENDDNKYHGTSVQSTTHHREYSKPVKYHFQYEVEDRSTGDIKSHQEERDGDLTKGKYSLHDPDGTIRTVDYVVKGESGFLASVSSMAQKMQKLHREKRIMKRLSHN